MPSRRRVLAGCTAAAGLVLAGCLAGPDDGAGGAGTSVDDPDTPTETCAATDPPAPTDAATTPRPYPERPTAFTAETVEAFLTEYARAYQYNDALAANPDKIGRLNEFSVRVRSVSVEPTDGGFAATVSGQLQSDILDVTATGTPDTSTETPLPMGHGPFEAAYVVTDRELRREGTVLECW